MQRHPVQIILRNARKVTRATCILGTHDDVARLFLGDAFGGTEILDEADHILVDARRFVVVYGGPCDAAAGEMRVRGFHSVDGGPIHKLRMNTFDGGACFNVGSRMQDGYAPAESVEGKLRNAGSKRRPLRVPAAQISEIEESAYA